MSGRSSFETKVELRHSTVLAQSGLVKLTNDSGVSAAMLVKLECFDSILTGGTGAAMIEQVAIEPYDIRRQLNWIGDHTFYDGFATLLRIQGLATPQKYTFSEWQELWRGQETQTLAEAAGFATAPPVAGRPLHSARSSDFRLRSGTSRAIGYAQGVDAGAALNELPMFPEAPRFLLNRLTQRGRGHSGAGSFLFVQSGD